ncbi:MAG: hypothetical protein JWO81_1984 [Alphaproteobacteria bacterium]|nr:hypothetical protein [Alphaproteobacteria bacterium]
MPDEENGKHGFGEEDARLLKRLRAARRRQRAEPHGPPPTAGQTIADAVAATMGSWPFIIIQTTILAFWILLNVVAWIRHWDPYPFILLNLALSFQAAYAAPFIMMSQNRQADVDRRHAQDDYKINIKAELEIELLHQKLDQLRETEVQYLTKAVNDLTDLINRSGICAPAAPKAGAEPG